VRMHLHRTLGDSEFSRNCFVGLAMCNGSDDFRDWQRVRDFAIVSQKKPAGESSRS
jgi:hypothetical protein